MNIELFPCSGGMAEGFRRAGVVFDMAVDKDVHACDSYEKNHGHRPIQMDAWDLLRMARAGMLSGLVGRIDLFVADPPCTPWSRAGKREGLDDPRDCLKATAELIAILRPRAYLIGNVPGLQDSTSWHVVQDVIGGLAAHGYCVADYASLDAADYGVPQHRVRPFWFGHLDGPCVRWPAPTHGAPTEQLAIGGAALIPWVTCRQALGHLSLEDLGRPVRMRLRERGEDNRKNGGDITRCSAPDGPAKTVVAKADRKGGQILIPGAAPAAARGPGVPNGGDVSMCSTADRPAKTVMAHEGIKGGGVLLVENEKHPPCEPGAPAPTIRGGGEGHSAPQVVLVTTAVEHPRHPISDPDAPSFVVKTGGGRASGNGSTMRLPELTRLSDGKHGTGYSQPDQPGAAITRNTHGEGATLAWPWDRPSTTVMKDERIQPPGHHSEGSIRSDPNAVILSERAAAILQGFPEDWTFSGDTKKARWSQIGQAMPPGLAEPVARAIVEQMRAARGERAA